MAVMERFRMYVTHCETSAGLVRIWGQTDRQTSRAVEMALKAAEPRMKAAPVDADTFKPGRLCVAEYGDGELYRARIEALSDDGAAAVVRFLDYGNSEIVERRRVRPLDPREPLLSAAPPQATGFMLAGAAAPVGGDAAATIAEMVRYAEVTCTTRGRAKGTVFVSIECEGADLCDALAERGIVARASPEDQERFVSRGSTLVAPPPLGDAARPPPETVDRRSAARRTGDPGPAPALTYKSRLLETNSVHEVRVCYAGDGPELFAVRVTGDERGFALLQGELSRCGGAPLSEPPMIGSVCAARFPGNGAVSRAVVIGLPGDSCRLFFVDFGATESVSFYDVYAIGPRFVVPSVYALRFCLSGVKELRISEAAKERFRRLVEGRVLKLRVVPPEGPPLIQYCELYLDGKSVRELLAEERAEEGGMRYAKISPNELAPGTAVAVAHVDGCARFFLRLAKNDALLGEIAEEVRKLCASTAPPRHSEIEPGMPICARFPDDGVWYRAIVANVRRDGFTVTYVDYGNDAEVTVDDLRPISASLMRAKAQAIDCSLDGFEDRPGDDAAAEAFETATADRVLFIRKVKVSPEKIFLVSLAENLSDSTSDVAAGILASLANAKAVPDRPNGISTVGSELWLENEAKTENDFKSDRDEFQSGRSDDDRISRTKNSSKNSNSAKNTLSNKKKQPESKKQHNISYEKNSKSYNRDFRNKPKKDYNKYDNKREFNQSENQRDYNKFENRKEYKKFEDNREYNKFEGKREYNKFEDKREYKKFEGKREYNKYDDRKEFNKFENKREFSSHRERDPPKKFMPKQLDDPLPLNVQYEQFKMEPEKLYDVKISWYIDPNNFYINIIDRLNEFDMMMNDIPNIYKGVKPYDGYISINDSVVAKYPQDNSLYRAKVIGKKDDQRYIIQYVDFGNKTIVNKSDLWQLDSKLFNLPALAIRCSISGISPLTEWSADAEKYFSEPHYSCKLVTFSDDIHYVSLINHGEQLSEKLIKGNLARSSDKTIVKHNKRPTERVLIEISHIDSPGQFWIKLKKDIDDIKIFQEGLQQITTDSLSEREEGKYCIAKYSGDDQYYRAVVLDTDNEITTVRLLDSGLTDSILNNKPELLRCIPAEYLEKPHYALKCSVNAIPSGTGQWNEQATELLKNISQTLEKDAYAVFVHKGETNYIDLYIGDDNITENLINAGYAVGVEETKSGALPNCYASHINSPSEFWIQLENSSADLKSIDEKLMEADNFPQLTEIEEEVICAAKFPEDGYWYRAQIIVHSSDGTEVLFMDYGNSSLTDELRVLPEELKSLPALSRRCALQKPNTIKNWSKEAEMKFLELAAEGAITFQVSFIASGDISIVDLFLNGKSITEELVSLSEIHLKHIVDVNYDESKIDVTQPQPCYISYCNCPDDFWIQYQSATEQLNLISEALVDAEKFEDLLEYSEESICVSLFPEDDIWYRSKILNHGENGTEVLHIDYGSKSIVSKLKILPNELAEIPPLAKHCAFVDHDQLQNEIIHEQFLELANSEGENIKVVFVNTDTNPALVKILLDDKEFIDKFRTPSNPTDDDKHKIQSNNSNDDVCESEKQASTDNAHVEAQEINSNDEQSDKNEDANSHSINSEKLDQSDINGTQEQSNECNLNNSHTTIDENQQNVQNNIQSLATEIGAVDDKKDEESNLKTNLENSSTNDNSESIVTEASTA